MEETDKNKILIFFFIILGVGPYLLPSVNFIPDTTRARSKLLKAGRNFHGESKEKKTNKIRI
jgi:hypothetical protein